MNIIRTPFSYRYNNVVLWLIGINTSVFIMCQIFPNLIYYASLIPAYAVYGKMYWQFLTYQFIHAPNSIWHIALNMLALFLFGTPVEQKMGSKEFLLFYLMSGTLGGIISALLYISFGNAYIILLGASGAIFGISLAYAVLFPRAIIALWGILPMPAPVFVLGYALLSIVSMITGYGGGISHIGHLSGLVVSWAYIRIRFGIKPLHVWGLRS